MKKGYNEEEGTPVPTSETLANRLMSLSLSQVNHVSSEGKNERLSRGEGEEKTSEAEVAVCRSEVLHWMPVRV